MPLGIRQERAAKLPLLPSVRPPIATVLWCQPPPPLLFFYGGGEGHPPEGVQLTGCSAENRNDNVWPLEGLLRPSQGWNFVISKMPPGRGSKHGGRVGTCRLGVAPLKLDPWRSNSPLLEWQWELARVRFHSNLFFSREEKKDTISKVWALMLSFITYFFNATEFWWQMLSFYSWVSVDWCKYVTLFTTRDD